MFSPDDQYLAAFGQNLVLMIWDTSNGQLVFNKLFDQDQECLCWDDRVGSVNIGERAYGIYNLVTANSKHVLIHRLEPDP